MTNIQKISSVILYIIAGLSIIFAGMYYLGGSVPETVGTITEEKNYTSLVLVWALILFIIAAILTLAFSIINVISNTKALKGALIILAIAVVLVGISYLMASSAPMEIANLKSPPTAGTFKWVGTGLNATYLLALVAFVGIIASEVIRAFK
jgi:hypothetical protein